MRRRQGFTLVELLVATALIMFIMVILTQAYTASMKAFQDLKAYGDMDKRLRTVSRTLRDDLSNYALYGQGNTRKYISDPTFFSANWPPTQGFFRIYNGGNSAGSPSDPYYTFEGSDGDGIAGRRAQDHILHFTMQKPQGNDRSNYFFGALTDPNSPLFATYPDTLYQVPGSIFSTTWAEVAYFLYPNGATAAGSTPLYGLYRRQLLVLDSSTAQAANTSNAANTTPIPNAKASFYSGKISMKVQGPSLYFNSPADLASPPNRLGMNGVMPAYSPPGSPNYLTYQPIGDGSDLLLTDVISFEVKPLVPSATDPSDPSSPYVPLYQIGGFNDPNNSFGNARVFDTWTQDPTNTYNANNVPLQVQIQALEITVRVWDFKSQMTRQMTIVKELTPP